MKCLQSYVKPTTRNSKAAYRSGTLRLVVGRFVCTTVRGLAVSLPLVAMPPSAVAQHPDIAPRQVLLDSTPNGGANFGWAVAAEGPWLAVGATGDIDSFGHRHGTVTMFEEDVTGVFVERQVLSSSLSSPIVTGGFGVTVAMHQGRMIVSAHLGLRPDGLLGTLHAYEHDLQLGWHETQVILDPPPTNFPGGETRGFSMCLRGDHLFVGSRTWPYSGRVIYYHHDGSNWRFISSITPSPAPPGVQMNFGWSLDVDLDAGLMVVGANIYPYNGAPGVPARSGAAFVFRLLGDGTQPYTIVQDAALYPPAPRENGEFGVGCAVLASGRIAVSTGSNQAVLNESYYEYTQVSFGAPWVIVRRGGFGQSSSRTAFLSRQGGVLYFGLPQHSEPGRQDGAVLVACPSEVPGEVENVVGLLWRQLGGVFPIRAPAVGDTFVAVGASDHYHTINNAGAVVVHPRPASWDCLRATCATVLCAASVTGCPGSGGQPLDPSAGCVNSTGQGGRLHYQGMTQTHFNSGRMLATGLPPGEMSVLLRSEVLASGPYWNPAGLPGLGSGALCLVNPLTLTFPVRRVEPDGTAIWQNILERNPPGPGWGFVGGGWSQVPFQVWYRDRVPGGAATSNTTNALLMFINF